MIIFFTQYIMEMIIEEQEIKIDVINNPMFHWTETLNLPSAVDWNQLQYQQIYKSPEYVASKFSGDFSNITGFDKIIDKIAVNSVTPLEELLSRYNIANEQQEDRDDTNISEFQNSQ